MRAYLYIWNGECYESVNAYLFICLNKKPRLYVVNEGKRPRRISLNSLENDVYYADIDGIYYPAIKFLYCQ